MIDAGLLADAVAARKIGRRRYLCGWIEPTKVVTILKGPIDQI